MPMAMRTGGFLCNAPSAMRPAAPSSAPGGVDDVGGTYCRRRALGAEFPRRSSCRRRRPAIEAVVARARAPAPPVDFGANRRLARKTLLRSTGSGICTIASFCGGRLLLTARSNSAADGGHARFARRQLRGVHLQRRLPRRRSLVVCPYLPLGTSDRSCASICSFNAATRSGSRLGVVKLIERCPMTDRLVGRPTFASTSTLSPSACSSATIRSAASWSMPRRKRSRAPATNCAPSSLATGCSASTRLSSSARFLGSSCDGDAGPLTQTSKNTGLGDRRDLRRDRSR